MGVKGIVFGRGFKSTIIPEIIVAHKVAALEELRGLNRANQQRLAVDQQAEIIGLEQGLVNAQSAARIQQLVVEFESLHLDSIGATIQALAEDNRLAALINEKNHLERLRAECNDELAERYFADPAHRLLKDISFVRAELSFEHARRWIFITAQALRYKWNQKVQQLWKDNEYTIESIFAARNAGELKDLFDAFDAYDTTMLLGSKNDDNYKIWSVRTDFLNLDLFEFRSYLEENVLSADHPENSLSVPAVRIPFNTVREGGLFFSRDRWLEKINFMRVKVLNSGVGGQDSLIPGRLKYGGTSWIRNFRPGSQSLSNPDRLMDEMTAYPVRHWYFDPELRSWQFNDALWSAISIQVAKDPDVPNSVYQINTFKEYSVAASDWTLLIALENNGLPTMDLSKVTDVQIHFDFYWYNRLSN